LSPLQGLVSVLDLILTQEYPWKVMKAKRLSKQEFLNRLTSRQLTQQQALAQLTDRLQQYEKKYNLRSEVFYKLIVGTPAEDNPDFLAWAICYRSYFQALKTHLSPQGDLPIGDLGR
jgi:hypothetical protein